MGLLHNVTMSNPKVAVVSDPLGHQAKQVLAGAVARMAVAAGLVDIVYFLFFLAIGSPVLAWVNVLSVLIYCGIYELVRRRRLALAIALFWLEVFPHAVLGTLMLGWGSGFHYLALIFVPMVMMTDSRLTGVAKTVFLVLVLASLEGILWQHGPLAPITELQLLMVRWFNLLLFVVMMAMLTSYYWGKIASAEKRLRTLGTVDALTGLHNRHYFEKAWSLACAQQRRAKGTLCLLMVDLDRFKPLNDTHGHQAGDRMLVECGRIFREAVRDIDTLARWGGEEFALLLPGTTLEQSKVEAERMRAGIEALVVIHQGAELRCTASVGLTEMLPADTLDQMIMRADQALYTSKMAGRNCVHSV
jgi:diguanylate cyclase (GGDEF)-like protein